MPTLFFQPDILTPIVPVAFDQVQVTDAAKIPADAFNHPHERLHVEHITIEREGYLYVYVSSQSEQNMDVYFDDLKVVQQYSDIVAGGDYYPFGLEIEDRQITREDYRHKYQGQYAEKDEETGWNSFQLRMYDARIGRWFNTDPYDQYFSPYTGMGNDPVSGVDPDGGYSRAGAWWRSGFSNDIYQSGGEWGYNTIDVDGFTFNSGRNRELSAKFEFELTAGPQAGIDLGILEADLNIASMNLLSFGYEQQTSDAGPEKIDFNYFGFNDQVKVKQGVALKTPLAGTMFERSFNANMSSAGYTDLKDKTATSVLSIPTIEAEVNRANGMVHQRESLDFSLGAKFIIGVDLKFSFGYTTDVLNNN